MEKHKSEDCQDLTTVLSKIFRVPIYLSLSIFLFCKRSCSLSFFKIGYNGLPHEAYGDLTILTYQIEWSQSVVFDFNFSF